MRLGFLLLPALAFVYQPAYAGLDQMATDTVMRDNLRLFGFNGMCAYFVSGPTSQLSPSTSDRQIWKTCYGHGTEPQIIEAGSYIYKVRVDCAAKQFAIVETATFNEQFWQGGVVAKPTAEASYFWRPLKITYKLLRDVCLPLNSPDRSLTPPFEGPASEAVIEPA